MSEQSPFTALEASFRLLCTGPSPLAVHGRDIGPPLPPRLMALDELAAVLIHPSTPYPVRDRAVCLVARRARDDRGAWIVGLAGLLLPGLRAAVADLTRACPDAAAELEAEMLAELVEHVAEFDTDGDRAATRLLWRVAQRARRRVVRQQSVAGCRVSDSSATEPRRPWGHPDFVLGAAVRAGVISASEAEMIGETRLGDVPVAEWARQVGWRSPSVRKERSVAERRLVKWMLSEKSTRDSASDASLGGAGRSPAVDEHEPARVAHTAVGPTREVSTLARRLPAGGAARPGLDSTDRRSA